MTWICARCFGRYSYEETAKCFQCSEPLKLSAELQSDVIAAFLIKGEALIRATVNHNNEIELKLIEPGNPNV
jgi:hypothetical protein